MSGLVNNRAALLRRPLIFSLAKRRFKKYFVRAGFNTIAHEHLQDTYLQKPWLLMLRIPRWLQVRVLVQKCKIKLFNQEGCSKKQCVPVVAPLWYQDLLSRTSLTQLAEFVGKALQICLQVRSYLQRSKSVRFGQLAKKKPLLPVQKNSAFPSQLHFGIKIC